MQLTGSPLSSEAVCANSLVIYHAPMRFFLLALVLPLCATFRHAQTAIDDASFLKQARAKYDVPFDRNLQSFTCAVEFNWKQHFTEVVRLGDEGTDEEIAKLIQPIHNRVTVTRQSATPSAGMTEDEVHKLPHGGMAEGLLEHAVQYSLNNWLAASGSALLPPEDTSVHIAPSTSGYKLNIKIRNFDVEMLFTSDLRLQSEAVKGSAADRRETTFDSGPQGFLLTSYSQGEDGDFKPGNRVIITYTYQNIDGYQLPEQISISRESHHEKWHYKLANCTVQTTK